MLVHKINIYLFNLNHTMLNNIMRRYIAIDINYLKVCNLHKQFMLQIVCELKYIILQCLNSMLPHNISCLCPIHFHMRTPKILENL